MTTKRMATSKICELFLFLWLLQEVKTGTISKESQRLHHKMTKRELEKFFGIDDVSQVPDYDITEPYSARDENNGQRQKRSLPQENDLNKKVLKMKVFDEEIPLKLSLNKQLMSSDMKVEIKRSVGRTDYYPAPQNTFYLGKVSSDPGSMVAVNHADGMHGVIRRSSDILHIHPLPSHLAEHVKHKNLARPHIVVKRSTNRNPDNRNSSQRDERSAEVQYKYLEVAMVTDEFMTEKYGESEIPALMLTIGNIVAGEFQDASIGPIKVVYVIKHISILNATELELTSASVGSIVSKIQAWANDNPNLADVDVVTYVSTLIGQGGRANVNTMCTSGHGATNVNSFLGLQSAGTIAHETGHNFGLNHDGEENSCPGGKNIMSSSLPSGPDALRWSKCCEQKLQARLRARLWLCLDNEPHFSEVVPAELDLSRLPGEIVDGDMQCKYQYGDRYYRLPQKLSTCGSLWCTSDGYSAISHNAPVSDGTTCGPRNWCIKGKCEDNGRARVDGGWSKWSGYTSCTFSCGGGVQHRTRTCTNPVPKHGGKSCKGPSIGKWRTCNFMHCVNAKSTYREMECLAIGENYVPYYMKSDPCGLYCRHGRSARKLRTVKDGNRVTTKGLDVCIQGKPAVVGCDHMLYSKKKMDRCNVCNGKADSCIDEIGKFMDKIANVGDSVLVKEVPPGTESAYFEKIGNTKNVIGIQDVYGKYLFDSLSVDSIKTIKYAGATIIYKHKGSRYKFKDSLEIRGPTNEWLKVVFVRVHEQTRGVNFMLRKRPVLSGESAPNLSYNWAIMTDWSVCPVTCAGGVQTRDVRCVETETNSIVSDEACDSLTMPLTSKECNSQACQPEWHITEWSPCSRTCGRGSRTRNIVCRQKVSSEKMVIVSDCTETKPDLSSDNELCNAITCPPEWIVNSKWSMCSTSCGPGIMTRQLICQQITEDGETSTVPDIECAYRRYRPATEVPCNVYPCPNILVKINPCDNNPCGDEATCSPDDSSLGYTCQEPILPCDSSPCYNDGTCVNDDQDVSKYHCQCPPWITGSNCEVLTSACESSPCVNDGYCSSDVTVDPSQYKCACSAWFTGKNCEVQIYPCDSNPCQNGATCNNDANDISKYNCQCKDFFTGIHCEVAQTICDTNNPCLNGRHCSSDTSSPAQYTCDCGDWFTGKNCEVRIYPCDSNPCVNGATCSNDDQHVSLYHCHCTGDYSGKQCQVPSFSKIACFNTEPYQFLPKDLGNFRDLINKDKPEKAIGLCAELAFDKGYKFFALGYNGKCRSGPNARDQYYKQGSTSDANCPNGIGSGKRFAVYTFELLPKRIPLGCFKERKKGRLLNVKFGSFVNSYDDSDPYATVIKCAHLARDMDIEYFAVQNKGDCRTDVNIVDNYDKYGEALPEKCVGGVGATWTNFVYRLRPAFTGPNVCDALPCQNGGTCVVHFNDPDRYYCECGDWFEGGNCEVAVQK